MYTCTYSPSTVFRGRGKFSKLKNDVMFLTGVYSTFGFVCTCTCTCVYITSSLLQDIEDKRVFAYITKDKSSLFYCHVFLAPSVVRRISLIRTLTDQDISMIRTLTDQDISMIRTPH